MNLTVNPTYTAEENDTVNLTICEAELETFEYATHFDDVTGAGTYTQDITFETATGCDSTITLTLYINVTPSIDPIDDVEECDSYTLPQLPEGFGYFAQSMGVEPVSGTITEDATIYVYAATGTENMCWAEDTFNVVINVTPEVGSFDNVQACDSYTLPELAVGTYYTASMGQGTQLNAGDILTDNATVYVYAVSGTDNMCWDEESFIVTIVESPEIVASQVSPAECGIPNSGSASVRVLSGGSGNYSYRWDNGNTNQAATNLSAGAHFVVITDLETGCTDITDVQITEEDTEAPTIICPEDIDTVITSEVCEVELSILLPDVDDNCSIGTVTNNFNNSTDASGIYPAGTTIVQWIATDNSGNADTCKQTVVVKSIPLANDDFVSIPEGTQTVEPLVNDIDCDNNIDTTTFEIITQPAHGTVSEIDLTNGTFNYTPEEGFTGIDSLLYRICDEDNLCGEAWAILNVTSVNEAPVAVDDSIVVGNCGGEITIDVTSNDYDPDSDELTKPEIITNVTEGTLVQNEDGTFTYNPVDGFEGTIQFTYEVCDSENPDVALCNQAIVTIHVMLDTDCDQVPDETDIDDDNDGILDIDETFTADNDGDGIPNYLDIDSDNDGIIDNIEAQAEGTHRNPVWSDSDGDGWDDQYDPDSGGTYFQLADTDEDGTPDFIDTDADDDGIDDYIEGFDLADENGIIDSIPETFPAGSDIDTDGLDDNYDNIDGWDIYNNPVGGNAPLPDYDSDGIRAWRDSDDKPEGGGDDNLVTGCELIVPNGFSPNNDGMNDYFKVVFDCDEGEQTFGEIYPDAKLYIYNRWGNLLYEKEHYGNTGLLGNADAWWDGYSEHSLTVGNDKVPDGTYVYILILDSGNARKGTVFVNY